MATSAHKNDLKIATAKARAIKGSPQKLNLLLAMIRGKHVDDALNCLTASRKRVSSEIYKLVVSSIANAENNHQLDIDRLYVDEAIVGRAFSLKRWDARARGRSVRIMKPYSNVRIRLREREV